MTAVLAHISGNSWDDWLIVAGPVVIFLAICAVVARPREGRNFIETAAVTMQRITKVPGWAAAGVGTALGGLILAALGFYWDVAWHIDLGRDQVLFTPPHTLILLGLGAILMAGLIAIALASATREETQLRVKFLRIPWSALALTMIGGGAVMGFPLDEMWHQAYGIDVTMWGPTHLIMIGGASITALATWLMLAEAGVKPERGTFGRFAHGTLAGTTLAGLSALQGEFDFGVPQFQLLYQPVMILLAASVAMTASRIVLGRGGALRAAIGFIAIRGLIAVFVGGFGHTVPHFPLYLAPAIAIEVAALVVGTEKLGRFALASGAGMLTIGLAGEWGWSHVWMSHPWPATMLPETLWTGALSAFGGAALGTALGFVVSGRAAGRSVPLVDRKVAFALVGALLAIGAALAIPIKRVPVPVDAQIALQNVGGSAVLELRLDPRDAVKDARWFEAFTWQSGELIIDQMEEISPGVYRTTRPMPITDKAKTLVRLHRGGEMGAVPVYFPEDREIGASEIPAIDRVARFERDSKLLMREAKPGNPMTARIIFSLLSAIVVAWIAVLAFAGTRIASRRLPPDVRQAPHYAAA